MIVDQVREARTRLGLTQAELAKAAGVSARVVSWMEAGTLSGVKGGSKSRKLLHYLGITPPTIADSKASHIATPKFPLGLALRAARLARGWTTRDMDARLGLCQSTTCNVELDTQFPGPTAKRIAAELGVDLAPFPARVYPGRAKKEKAAAQPKEPKPAKAPAPEPVREPPNPAAAAAKKPAEKPRKASREVPDFGAPPIRPAKARKAPEPERREPRYLGPRRAGVVTLSAEAMGG